MAFITSGKSKQSLLIILFHYDKEVVTMRPTTNPCVLHATTAKRLAMAVVKGAGGGGIKSLQPSNTRPVGQ